MKKITKIKTIGQLRRKPKATIRRTGSDGRGPSNVTAHDYDPKTGHLTVTFHGGRRYRYSGVSEDKAAEFSASESKGAFLHREIIGNHPHTIISD